MMLAVGDKVRWAAGILAHGEPMRVVAVHPRTNQVEIHSGSRVSTSQVVLVERAPPQPQEAEMSDELLEVIQAQMEALSDMAADLADERMWRANTEALYGEAQGKLDALSYDEGQLEGYQEAVQDMLGKLCIAMGYDRVPLATTGIRELDVLVRYVHSL